MGKKKELVVYTAITGNYDVLRNPKHIDPDIEYVCFTDEVLWTKLLYYNTVWKIRPLPRLNGLDLARQNRRAKFFPHLLFPEYEYSVYVDGNIDIIGDIRGLLNAYDYPDMLVFKHPQRACAYVEGPACVEHKKAPADIVMKQLAHYKSEGFPENNGLFELNVLMRRHHQPHVAKLMEAWWQQLLLFSARDQLSFPYVAWKSGVWPTTMGEQNARGNSEVFDYNYSSPHYSGSLNVRQRWDILFERYIKWRL